MHKEKTEETVMLLFPSLDHSFGSWATETNNQPTRLGLVLGLLWIGSALLCVRLQLSLVRFGFALGWVGCGSGLRWAGFALFGCSMCWLLVCPGLLWVGLGLSQVCFGLDSLCLGWLCVGFGLVGARHGQRGPCSALSQNSSHVL